MRPIRETKSQPRPMRGLRIASGRCACRKIYCQLRWTRPLPSGPWTCPPAPRRLRAARCLAANERRLLCASAARRMRSGACAPLRAGHIRAAPRRLRAPRLGTCARRGSAAPPRLRTPLPRVAAPPRPPRLRSAGLRGAGVEGDGGRRDGNIERLNQPKPG
jgi:hypothetical protein